MKLPRRPSGSALITAVFIMGTLVTLALAMVTMSQVSQDTGTKSLLSARVYYGAKAGLDWGIQRAIAASNCAASTSFTLTQGALAGVAVTVTCSSTTHGAGNLVYYISSAATTGTLGQLDYAERHMEATVNNLP